MKIIIELDLPGVPEAQLQEYARLGVEQFVGAAHQAELARWRNHACIGSPDEDKSSKDYAMYQYHKTWNRILASAQWSYSLDSEVVPV